MIKLKELLNEAAGKLSISQLPLDFIFKYPIGGTSKPGNFEDWYRDGMKLKKGRIEKFSPEDDKKLRSLINIWWDEYDDVPMADFNNGRDSKEIKKVKKDILDFLKQKSKVITEVVTEGPQKVGNVNAFGASKVLGKGKKVLGFVPDTPNAVATLIQDFPQAMEIEFKQGFFSDGKLLKSIKKGDKVWKELEKRYLDKQTKDAMKAGFNIVT